ncbi:MAG TPA: methyltransferase domain-containing protein [Nannocystis sp.]
MSAADYARIWDDYWNDAASEIGQVFWDSPTTQAVEAELDRFGAHLDLGLPMIDVGCGHGTQTRALAGRFARVIGVDVSAAAIEIARTANPGENVAYEVLDVLDVDAAAALHRRIGDANLYVRTVIHQLGEVERVQAVASLSTLVGARGRALVTELAPSAEAYFEYLFAEFGGPPPGLARVLRHGIRPAALREGDLARAFALAGLVPVAQGRGAVQTTLTLPGGYPAMVPTDIIVFGRAP